MKLSIAWMVFVAGLSVRFCLAAPAEHHRATHLGNPATRFAPPIATAEEMRSRFRDERLRPDFASVLKQWGWTGDLADLHQAAQTAPVEEIRIAIGTTMPFMSTRQNGRAICLRNVLWAGPSPAPAFAFKFTSKGRRYRCVTPRACSNFFVEDLGPVLLPALALDCTAPAQVLPGRTVQFCVTLHNSGNGVEPKATIQLPVPQGATFVNATENGTFNEQKVNWEVKDLAPGAARTACATFMATTPGALAFQCATTGQSGKPAQTSCSSEVIGIPAILIDAVDMEDPVEVGHDVTYVIKVTNQGSAPGTNVRLACTIPAEEEFVSGGGITPMRMDGGLLVTEPVPSLDPKAEAVWRVVVKAKQAGDVRFRIDLSSDQFQRPILEEESTHLY